MHHSELCHLHHALPKLPGSEIPPVPTLDSLPILIRGPSNSRFPGLCLIMPSLKRC
jgi:hypothetical protein